MIIGHHHITCQLDIIDSAYENNINTKFITNPLHIIEFLLNINVLLSGKHYIQKDIDGQVCWNSNRRYHISVAAKENKLYFSFQFAANKWKFAISVCSKQKGNCRFPLVPFWKEMKKGTKGKRQFLMYIYEQT